MLMIFHGYIFFNGSGFPVSFIPELTSESRCPFCEEETIESMDGFFYLLCNCFIIVTDIWLGVHIKWKM